MPDDSKPNGIIRTFCVSPLSPEYRLARTGRCIPRTASHGVDAFAFFRSVFCGDNGIRPIPRISRHVKYTERAFALRIFIDGRRVSAFVGKGFEQVRINEPRVIFVVYPPFDSSVLQRNDIGKF